jgi:hypothetical protein
MSQPLWKQDGMISLTKICIATFLALQSVSSSRADDIPVKETLVMALQQAVRNGDKSWLADHTRYPLRFNGRANISIRNKTSFVKNYPTIIGSKLRAAVLAQDPENVFENWQGMMVGEGNHNIWIRDAGSNGLDQHYELIAINDVE